MWTATIVRDRFAEAAATERRLPHEKAGPSEKMGFWPEYQDEVSDLVAKSAYVDADIDFTAISRADWHRFARGRELDRARLEEIARRNNRRLPPSPGEISRWEEVLCVWTPDYLRDEKERRLVWYWAFCASGGKSFAAVCRKKGWVRRTAYARLDRLFERVAGDLVNDCRFLSDTSDLQDCTGFGFNAFIPGTLNELSGEDIPVSPRSWSDGEASGDHPEIRDFSWSMNQAEREAKRRRKAEAGMPRPEAV